MGNNDFAAGDPWGLPIEESEDFELGGIRPEEEPPSLEGEPEEGLHAEEIEPTEAAEEDTGFDEHPADAEAHPGETTDEPDAESADLDSRPSETEPLPASEPEPHEEAPGVWAEEDEEGDAGRARAPLSQMIAAAQSIVSSVQGDEPGESGDGRLVEPHGAEQTAQEETAETEQPSAVEGTEVPQASGFAPLDIPAGDDDLPQEPPSWMIEDGGDDQEPPTPHDTEGFPEPADTHTTDDERTFTPEDIEASLAGLATTEPAGVPFAEDRFETPGAEEPERDYGLGDVDMDSAPGVYSELHDLADQDEQAEALLREAAEAFGQAEQAVESLEEDTEPITEYTPESPEQIDSFAEALAAEIEPDDTTLLEEDTEPITEYTPESPEQIDSFADSEGPQYLSDTELSDALSALDEATAEDVAAVPEEEAAEEEAPVDDWWSEAPGLAAVVESAPAEEAPEPEAVEPPPDETPHFDQTFGDETTVPADESVVAEDAVDEQAEDLDVVALSATTGEGTAVIDSPVEWGTRYREAHQGWVEDDDGRSTWRPIVTSGESVAGWEIDIYLGLVSGDVTIGPVMSDEVAGDVAAARDAAVRRMLDEALARGAHAVVGVTFAVQDVANTVLVSASGVAVTLRTPA